jgi:type I restriction enzyme M protein
MEQDSDFSRTFTLNELYVENYNIDPSKKMSKPVEIRSGVKLGDIVKSIAPGAQLTVDVLDELASDEPTKYHYLTPRDIQDGIISDSLPYLKYIEPQLEKHCISPGDLLLSKNGAPFKIAVADDFGDQTVLANSSLYVIKLDANRVRPFYLKAFLESGAGAAVLNNIAVGSTLPVIQISALLLITIPCPPLDEQIELEEGYLKSIMTVKDLKIQLASAIKASKGFFKEAN